MAARYSKRRRVHLFFPYLRSDCNALSCYCDGGGGRRHISPTHVANGYHCQPSAKQPGHRETISIVLHITIQAPRALL